MKIQTLGLLAILPLVVGMAGFSSIGAFQESSDIGSYGDDLPITGHVTVIHRDAQGSILGYQQYDNIIVNEGLNCITEIVFATTNATCAAASTTDQFDKIGLLGSTPSPVATDTAATLNELTGGGLTTAAATTIGVDVAGDGSGGTQGKSITGIQHTFTKTNSTAATIGGATLTNGAEDALFAAKAFTGGDVVLNESDTLEITWSIQIGS